MRSVRELKLESVIYFLEKFEFSSYQILTLTDKLFRVAISFGNTPVLDLLVEKYGREPIIKVFQVSMLERRKINYFTNASTLEAILEFMERHSFDWCTDRTIFKEILLLEIYRTSRPIFRNICELIDRTVGRVVLCAHLGTLFYSIEVDWSIIRFFLDPRVERDPELISVMIRSARNSIRYWFEQPEYDTAELNTAFDRYFTIVSHFGYDYSRDLDEMLRFAISYSVYDVIEKLLVLGADPDRCDALDLAVAYRGPEGEFDDGYKVVDLLLGYGVTISRKNLKIPDRRLQHLFDKRRALDCW